jgi:heme oxygenase
VYAADDGSDAFCWGIAYVLEGSRLGGQVLYRRLQPRFAPHPLHYLSPRPATAQSWPQTLALLRDRLGTPSGREAGCRGAVAAFEVLLGRFHTAGCL